MQHSSDHCLAVASHTRPLHFLKYLKGSIIPSSFVLSLEPSYHNYFQGPNLWAAECQRLCQAADCQEPDSLKGDINATLSKGLYFPNLPDNQLISNATNDKYALVDVTS